jgi:two-component system nitrogen regulation sensor histidine kinase GlnL
MGGTAVLECSTKEVHEYLDFQTDAELRVTNWGESLAAATGVEASAAFGKKYHEILPPIMVGDEDALLRSVRRQEEISFKDYRINCFSGHMVADITIRPLLDGSEVRIAPSVECSAIAKLRESQRLIDLGKIASALAHGVRNPLNAIKGAVVYLGERYADDATLVEFTKIMDEEIGRLDHFISKFLSTSLADLSPPRIDVNETLRKVEVLTSLQLQARNIKADFRFGDVPEVLVNSFHMEQAVLNIINNSSEAMEAGGTIFVRSMSKRRNGNQYAVVEIADEGPGLSMKGRRMLESPSGKNGRGFGLFLTRETMQYYGGQVEIRSPRGQGTTVRLYLPAFRADEADNES